MQYKRVNYQIKKPRGVVETIIIINIICFIPWVLFKLLGIDFFLGNLILYFNLNINMPLPYFNITNGGLWQVISAMFLHGGIAHLIFNMYALYIFGKPLENIWGGGRFLSFYLITGIFANIFSVLFYLLFGRGAAISMIGASGAIFAILIAFGAYYPDVTLYLFFAIPIKTKWAIVLFTALSLFFQVSGSMSRIGHVTHLFGFLSGFLYLLIFMRINAIKKMFFSKDDYIIR